MALSPQMPQMTCCSERSAAHKCWQPSRFLHASGRSSQLVPSAPPAILATRMAPSLPQAAWQAMSVCPNMQLTIVANHPTPRAPSQSPWALPTIAVPSASPAAACHPGSKGPPSPTTAGAGSHLWCIGNFLQPACSCQCCSVAQQEQQTMQGHCICQVLLKSALQMYPAANGAGCPPPVQIQHVKVRLVKANFHMWGRPQASPGLMYQQCKRIAYVFHPSQEGHRPFH